MKKALITGITGQDGSYLAEILLEKGYEVHGIIRRSSSFNTGRIDHILPGPPYAGGAALPALRRPQRLLLPEPDPQAPPPDEIYNLGAQSHVKVSFDVPEYTGEVTGLGAVRLLEAIRELGLKDTRIYQASSSEMFGASPRRRTRRRPSTRAAPTAAPRCTPTGSG